MVRAMVRVAKLYNFECLGNHKNDGMCYGKNYGKYYGENYDQYCGK